MDTQTEASLQTAGLSHEQIVNFQPQADELKDKVILVTGAGDGIGRVAALTYASYGAKVLLLGKTSSKLEAVYDEIEQAGGQQPAMLPINLEAVSYTELLQLANFIETEFGRLDGILHNAAILGKLVPLEEYNFELFEQVMRVNFTATFMLTQALFGLLKVADNASVVFTSSSVGKNPRALWGAYSLSKQGVEGMSEIFTQENRDLNNIRFNCINPGGTRTSMRASAYPQEDVETVKTAESIMDGYVCLMSDASKGVLGQLINF